MDLYLIHAPVPYPALSKSQPNQPAENVDDTNLFPRKSDNKSITIDVDYVDTWRKLEALVASGRVKSIGVSNFNSVQTDRLIQSASIKPVVNQVECHANLNQRKLIDYLKERNVLTVCFSPLGRPSVNGSLRLAIDHPTVHELSVKYKKTPAQIVLRYSVGFVFTLFPLQYFWHILGNLLILSMVISAPKWTYHDSEEHKKTSLTRKHQYIRL